MVKSVRKTKEGTVLSNKMMKTVVVSEERKVMHPLYKKRVKKTKKYKAHCEEVLSIGDFVRIEETRPLSKEKRWRVVDVIKKAVVEV